MRLAVLVADRKEIDFPYKIENNIYFLYPFPVHLFRRMDYDFFDKFIDDCGGEFLYPPHTCG
jgi:hypothetical protein